MSAATSSTPGSKDFLVSTSEQTAGTDYTVAVGEGVSDVTGQAVTAGAAPLTVKGFQPPDNLVINEVDYDMPGTGDSVEFIEFYNPTSSAVSLVDLAVTLVNGSSTTSPPAEYKRIDLGTGSLEPGQYLVIGSAALLLTVTDPNVVKIDAFTVDGVQNGSKDALAIVSKTNGAIVDTLSYEGEVPGYQEGTASTTAVNDAGSTASVCRLPNGLDTDSNGTDFGLCATPTPGAANAQ